MIVGKRVGIMTICENCDGTGEVSCGYCDGTGMLYGSVSCSCGNGRTKCLSCFGTGTY